MELIAANSAIINKTRELCQTILDQPEFQNLQKQITAFMTNDQVQEKYRFVAEKGQMLRQKQEQGQELGQAEIDDFEKHRDELLAHPVAKEFFEAQETMHDMKKSVTQYVSKTLELGRIPEESEITAGSCGSGCNGCH